MCILYFLVCLLWDRFIDTYTFNIFCTLVNLGSCKSFMQAAVSLEHNKKCAFLSASSESSINIFNIAIYDKHFTWITVSTSHTRNEPVIYIAYSLSEGSDRSTDRVGLFRKQEKSGLDADFFWRT